MPKPNSTKPSDAGTEFRAEGSIARIGRDAWDACANPGWPSDRPLDGPAEGKARPYNPFVCYDFLDSLEQSGSATARTGWAPRHLVASAPDGAIVGVMPAYLKSHSMGEYVFDHGWADAFEGAGGR